MRQVARGSNPNEQQAGATGFERFVVQAKPHEIPAVYLLAQVPNMAATISVFA
ncbi:hypothetical protein CFBP2044_04810 [Xanthomonas hortorum pv. cynarae]|nr:hypothetical protein CFBP2044_04810 [Xanthomonas hortorum pv. cynarae]CAD0303510.1 hypothetical protein CFBP2044_04810 [Xanthomonas hortorum pv. cynarae]